MILPTREQIAAIADPQALADLLTDVERGRAKIEVDLEFMTEGNEDWERRARNALTAYRITEKNLRSRIHRIGKPSGVEHAQLEAAQRSAKAERKTAAASAELANAERKRAKAEADRLESLRSARKMIERTSYLHHFSQAAHALLDKETMSRLAAEAHRLQQASMLAVIDEAAA